MAVGESPSPWPVCSLGGLIGGCLIGDGTDNELGLLCFDFLMDLCEL